MNMPKGIYNHWKIKGNKWNTGRKQTMKSNIKRSLTMKNRWKGDLEKWKIRNEKIREEHFAKYGWKCLVIWDDEIVNQKELLNKINIFLESNVGGLI